MIRSSTWAQPEQDELSKPIRPCHLHSQAPMCSTYCIGMLIHAAEMITKEVNTWIDS